MLKIKPCRFCGSTNARPEFKESKEKGEGLRFRAYVKCLKCHARGPCLSSINAPEIVLKELAVESWNGDAEYLREAANNGSG